MHFREQFGLRNMELWGGLEFVIPGDREVQLSLRPSDGKPTARGVLAVAICVADPPADLDAELRSLVGGGPPHLSPALDQFVAAIRKYLLTTCLRVVRITRWRTGDEMDHAPLSHVKSFDWSDDCATWHRIPMKITMQIAVGFQIRNRKPDGFEQAVTGMVQAGKAEPLGHELFREAWAIRRSNPRSALLIAVAAAEVRFKELVSSVSPQAEWLVTNTPSPDLMKMLREYLPTLPTRLRINDGVWPPPRRVRRLLTKAIEARNRIAHSAGDAIVGTALAEILHAIRDLLYLLDVYAGEQWARDNVSRETQEELVTEIKSPKV